jgi:hypothetical protein
MTRGAVHLLSVVCMLGCDLPYGFPPSVASIPNPAKAGTGDTAIVVARDGESQHRILRFSAEEACFLSSLDGIPGDQAQGMQFSLMAFRSADEPTSKAAKLASSTVKLQGTNRRLQQTTGGPSIYKGSVVEVCFAKPTSVVGPDTTYMVLEVPHNPNAHGSQDGIWRLTN